MPVPKGSTIDPERTRAAILKAATPVLYERGLDGIGVAELCALIGVSKETLYRHFGTKDGLVEAMLRARSERVGRWLAEAVAAAGDDPRDQLAAVFDTLGEWFEDPVFRGCAMVNAAAQHHDETVRAVTTRHLGRYIDLLTGIAERAGAADPPLLGRQLLMLVEGATVVAAHHGAAGTSGQAREAALTLLSAATQSADGDAPGGNGGNSGARAGNPGGNGDSSGAGGKTPGDSGHGSGAGRDNPGGSGHS
ncbi:TetR family transcriptional regulator [Microbispora sp. SCL1-1]|uniref:TetR/AcrR family transcriptional regulator n=1 Tax=unclassified Microbispora TaxID=2614687 RepID=UPI00115A0590|nr:MULTISPECIES: TetR/AcrR family transcriptional regulator [unclassified Microbispora]NJP23067.1 TetR family transcriptional regulator [Microbispora sp. CL1-1]TQS17067.1 TetR family transcriptional regulator [Microbispora sp. SCL1-1]